MSSTLRFCIIGMLMTTALALGLVVVNLSRPAPAPVSAQLPPPLTSAYLVAARTLPAGTLARDEDFATRSVASADLPSGAIVDSPENKAGLRGSLIRVYLETGDPVTSAAILRPRN